MRYSLINIDIMDIVRRADFDAPPPQLPIAKGLQWAALVEPPQPVIDEATQRAERSALSDLGGGSYGYTWTIVALTQQEQDAREARLAAEQAAQALAAADAADLATAKADSVVRYIVTRTPAEINTYVQTNVTNLATAKDLIAKLAVAVSVLAKDKLR